MYQAQLKFPEGWSQRRTLPWEDTDIFWNYTMQQMFVMVFKLDYLFILKNEIAFKYTLFSAKQKK